MLQSDPPKTLIHPHAQAGTVKTIDFSTLRANITRVNTIEKHSTSLRTANLFKRNVGTIVERIVENQVAEDGHWNRTIFISFFLFFFECEYIMCACV